MLIMPQKSTCSDHKAVNRVSTTQGHLQATGIGAVACARHGCFFPQSVVDFQKGERSGSNSLRCLLLISIPDKSTLIVLFAKACIRWKAILMWLLSMMWLANGVATSGVELEAASTWRYHLVFRSLLQWGNGTWELMWLTAFQSSHSTSSKALAR